MFLLLYSSQCHLAIALCIFFRLAISFLRNRGDSRFKSCPRIWSHSSKYRCLCRSFYHSCTRLHKNRHLSSAKLLGHAAFLIKTGLDNWSHFPSSISHILQDLQLHTCLYKYLRLQKAKVLNPVFLHLLPARQ